MNKNKLEYSSFIGGSGGDGIEQIEITRKQKLLLVGRTGSQDFSITENALYNTIKGSAELVIFKTRQNTKKDRIFNFYGWFKK